jgi:hypothetical protein
MVAGPRNKNSPRPEAGIGDHFVVSYKVLSKFAQPTAIAYWCPEQAAGKHPAGRFLSQRVFVLHWSFPYVSKPRSARLNAACNHVS